MENTKPNLRIVAASSLVLFAAYAAPAAAHTQSGSLGSSAAATDVYSITCSNDGSGTPARIRAQVRDQAPVAAPVVSVQVTKGSLGTNSSDATDGDAVYSPLVTVNGGSGAYTVLVNKTAAGSETYTLQYHCETSTGIHTGTSIVTRQNQ